MDTAFAPHPFGGVLLRMRRSTSDLLRAEARRRSGVLPATRFRGARHIPRARCQIVEPNQVDLVAGPVFRGLEQILHGGEARLACQIAGDVSEAYRLDRIDDDLPFVHPISPSHLDVRTRPDSDAAANPSAPYAFAKVPGERHGLRALPDDQNQRDDGERRRNELQDIAHAITLATPPSSRVSPCAANDQHQP